MRRNLNRLTWTLVLAASVFAGCNSAWVSSGLIYREQQGDYAKAEEMFKRAIDRSRGTEAIAFYELGNTLVYRVINEHLANGEVDSARIKIKLAHDSYLKAAELKPEEYEYNPLADDEAEQRVVENAIQSAYAQLYNGAVQRMNSERFDEAIVWLEMAYLADPRGASGFDAQLLRAQLLYNQQAETDEPDPDALRTILAQLEPLQVDEAWDNSAEKKAELVQAKARVLRGLGRENDATALYEDLLAESPRDIALLRQVANARQSQGDFAEAGELYRRAFDVAAGDSEADDETRFELGYFAMNAFLRSENYESVIDIVPRVQQFADTNDRRSRLARGRARAHFELEENDLAIASIEPVVEDGGYDPNNIEAWQIYYLALGRAGRTDESIAARERFIALRDGTN